MLWVKKKKNWVSNTVQNKEFKISQIFYWRYVEMTSGYIQLNKIYDEIISVTSCLMWLLENKFEFHTWQRWSFDGTTLLYTCGGADRFAFDCTCLPCGDFLEVFFL